MGELEELRDKLAIAWRRRGRAAQAAPSSSAATRDDRADAGRARLATSGCGSRTTTSGAGLQALALPSPPRPDRHAARLVARPDLLRLPVTSGARADAPRPRSSSSTAARSAPRGAPSSMPRDERRKRRRPTARLPAAPKRGTEDGEAPRPARPARPGPPDRPPAPWGKFPLVELIVLLALVMLILGFFVQGDRGITLIAAGVALGSLAGLELAIREHFAGIAPTRPCWPARLRCCSWSRILPAGGLAADRRLRRVDPGVRGRRLPAERGLQAPLRRPRLQDPLTEESPPAGGGVLPSAGG